MLDELGVKLSHDVNISVIVIALRSSVLDWFNTQHCCYGCTFSVVSQSRSVLGGKPWFRFVFLTCHDIENGHAWHLASHGLTPAGCKLWWVGNRALLSERLVMRQDCHSAN